jgi:hypothetical protein
MSNIVDGTPQPGESYFDSVNEYWALNGIGNYNPEDRSTNTFGGAGTPKQVIVAGE